MGMFGMVDQEHIVPMIEGELERRPETRYQMNGERDRDDNGGDFTCSAEIIGHHKPQRSNAEWAGLKWLVIRCAERRRPMQETAHLFHFCN